MKNLSYLLTHPDVITCCPEARILSEDDVERILQLPISARSLSLDESQSFIQNALQENYYGKVNVPLLADFLKDTQEETGQEAHRVARALDRISTRFTMGLSQESADRNTRGRVLIQLLCEIGEPKYPEVYAPFLDRVRLPAEYAFHKVDVSELRKKFPHIPAFARNEICKALLSREEDNQTSLFVAEQMFAVLDQLSPDTQDLVFERTKAFFEARGPLTDIDKEMLRDDYPVDFIAEVFPDQPEQRKKWNDLIEAACSGGPEKSDVV